MSSLILINALEFAHSAQQLNGTFKLSERERLADDEQFAHTDSIVHWWLEGGKDALSRPYLLLTVRSQCSLVCQRCLEALDFSFESQACLTLFTSEDALDAACEQDDALDGLYLEAEELEIGALIEDEILLGLPLSPHHDSCKILPETNASSRPNPFAVLAGLKKS